jgi:methionine-R-sulfoxide reductase
MTDYKKTDEAIAKLTPEQFHVTQQSGTERPGTGEYLNTREPGLYVDIVSGEPLFASADKFDSHCGWPSFTKPIMPEHVAELHDRSHGMVRNTFGGCRQPSRPRVRGWPAGQGRPALLHQLGVAAVRPPRRHGGQRVCRLPATGRRGRLIDLVTVCHAGTPSRLNGALFSAQWRASHPTP